MAAKGDITANVGLNVQGGGLDGVVDSLENKILKVIANIEKIGSSAALANDKGGKAATVAVAKLDGQIRELQIRMGQIQSLSKVLDSNLKTNRVTGTDASDMRLARQVRAIADFRKGMDEAVGTAEKLRVRINDISKETANLARQGQQIPSSRIRQQQQLEQNLKDYEKFATSLSTLQGKAGMLNPNSQKQLESMFFEAQRLKNVFNDLAGDKRRYDFSFLTEAQRSITLELDKQISKLSKQEQLERSLLTNTRERAQSLLSTNSRDRQIDLERSARSLQNRLTPTQTSFGAAVGEEGLSNRLARATNAYATARIRLAEAIKDGSGASQQQVAKLVEQYQRLENKIKETLALQGRAAAESAKTQTGPATPQSAFGRSVSGLLGDGGLGLASRVGIYAIAAQGVYSLITAVKDGAKFVVEFEDTLATLKAISGTTDSQLKSLSESILTVATNSRFSAVEIAEATVQLAQAGFSATDMKDALGSVTQFAAASGTSVKESVDLITSALGSFQLAASDTTRITDVMVAALNRSKLTSQQIAQAIQYVGTTAYEQNISLEQMVATIGSVAQAGVKAGSTLGTGFRQFLVDLANPTEKLKEELSKLGLSLADVDVKSRGLPAVLNTLKEAGFGAAQAYEGLEVRAAAFYLAAKNNTDVSNQLMLAESERGVALRANEAAMDSLTAQTQRFYNILAALATDNAPLDFFKGMLTLAGDLLEQIRNTGNELDEFDKRAREGKEGAGEQLAVQARDFFSLESALKGYQDTLRGVLDLGVTTGQQLGLLGNDVKGLGTQWLEYTDRITGAKAETDEMATATAEASDAAAQQAQRVGEVTTELNRLLLQGPSLRNDTIQTSIQTNNLTSRFEGLASMLGSTSNAYDNLISAMRRYRTEQLNLLGQKAAGEEAAARNQAGSYSSQANGVLAGIRGSAAFNQLGGEQRNQFNRIIQDYNRNTPGSLSNLNDFANKLGANFSGLQTDIRRLTTTLSGRSAAFSQARAAQGVQQDARMQADPVYRAVSDRLMGINADLGQNLANTREQTPAQRSATLNPILKKLDTEIGRLNNLITVNQGNSAAVRNLQSLRGEAQSSRNQIIGIIRPTQKETKASERAQSKAEAIAARQARAAERAQNKYNANDLTASQSSLKAADRTLNAYLNGAGVGLMIDKIEGVIDTGDDALESWITARREVLQDAITKAGMTPAQIEEMTAAANEEIAAKQKSTYDKQVSVIDKGINDYLTRIGKTIENQYKEKNLDATRNLGTQQAIADSLQNPLIASTLPDSVKTVQQRRVLLAQLELSRQQAGIQNRDGSWMGGSNQTRIDQYEADFEKLSKLSGVLDQLSDEAIKAGNKEKTKAYGDELERLQGQMGDLRTKADELTTANENLRHSLDATALAPKNLGQRIQSVASEYLIDNNIDNDPLRGLANLGQNLFGQSIKTATSGLGTALDEIINKTKTVGQAFREMGSAVVKAIIQMATQAIATQIFGLLLSFIPGGSAGAGLGKAGGSKIGSIVGQAKWNGGTIDGRTPQRLLGGGAVSQGLPTRDSALVHAAKGEFMLRRSSVESIGHDLLNDMNNRGVKALNGMGNKNIVVPQSQLNSSVYVVLPEERPQLGPNDVLAVVNRDMLSNGNTKQLIKQIAAGG